MYYGSTIKATNFTEDQLNDWRVRLFYFVFFFIPKANPDNEKMYPLVKKWLVEINDEQRVIREIALDKDNKAIFSSPNRRNYGFWTDSVEKLDKSEFEPIDKNYFEQLWCELNSNEKENQ